MTTRTSRSLPSVLALCALVVSPLAAAPALAAGKAAPAGKGGPAGKAAPAGKGGAATPTASAEPARTGLPTVVPFPLDGDDEDARRIGLAVSLKLAAALHETGRFNHVHVRQIRAMALAGGRDPERFSSAASAVAGGRELGATAVVVGRIELTPAGGITAVMDVRAVGGTKTARAVATGRMARLPALLSLAASKALDAVGKVVPPEKGATRQKPRRLDFDGLPPETGDAAALDAYLRCYERLLDQEIGIRNPALLVSDGVGRAIAECKAAVDADGKFRSARAALGLAQAMIYDHEAAASTLAKVGDVGPLVPEQWLGNFWLQSRYFAVYKGVQVLEEAIRHYPAFLLARGYLGEVHYATRAWLDAASAFEAYLAQAPQHPWVMSQLGRVQARLGDPEGAELWGEKALALAPGSVELRLQAASRLIDGERWQEAELALSELIEGPGAKLPTPWVRRGWVRMQRGNMEGAERDLMTALEKSTGRRDWQARAFAHFDLAIIRHRAGEASRARDELAAATAEGYPILRDRGADPDILALMSQNFDARKLTGVLPLTKDGKDDVSTLTPPAPGGAAPAAPAPTAPAPPPAPAPAAPVSPASAPGAAPAKRP